MSDRDVDLNSQNLSFVEGLYADYLKDPSSVPTEWHSFFDGIAREDRFPPQARLGPSFHPPSLFDPAPRALRNGGRAAVADEMAARQDKVDQLIRAYRVRGHLIAVLDPLGRPRPRHDELEPEFYGLHDDDLERTFSATTLFGPERLTLREILQRLRNTYCRSIGVQFMHIDDWNVKMWLQQRMESTENRIELRREEQFRILTRLTDAVILEDFIQKKFLGAKSFSLEGSESLIPLLETAIERAGDQGVNEIVLGMAHRGRLNVLVNVMGKSPRKVFREFEDPDPRLHLGRGDVKYHMGYSNDWVTSSGRNVHLSLCFNPSHLEYVNPVAVGRVRAKQDRVKDTARRKGMAVLIHGDAAFAGEGIVQETLNMSQLEGYRTGGTLHIVVNNQLGFTTSPEEGRSTVYATDVARMLQSPVFHVNGEDPEAVAQVIRLAMDFRKTFQRDVVIDMYCYRRRGHNEGDEPTFTQPVMYDVIEKRPSVREGYLDHLLKLGGVTREQADKIAEERREHLEKELSAARSDESFQSFESLEGIWKGYMGGPEKEVKHVPTGVDRKRLSRLLERMADLPEDFHPHPKIERGLAWRREMAAGKRPIDWASAEALALATLATEGYPVRLTGQDCARGTFSQRHSLLYDVKDGHVYPVFGQLEKGQAAVEIHNSPLSEAGVLGFEYGYSLDCPEGLILWEAQFGDFINAAQVIVDQFIASAEDKWRRLSGLVLLLPHGFEGLGPEHSSARLERFLLLAAEDNIQVAQPSTPAQYFHILRRQILRPWRKPLILMTPKSLLRHPKVVSSLEELETTEEFHRILPDANPKKRRIDRILLCSGKIYYDLEKEREESGREDIAILRMEQYYPLPDHLIERALSPYTAKTPVYWVQEEPENMGAWPYLRARFGETLLGRHPLRRISRPASSSPATGSGSSHKLEQRMLVEESFGK